jgi:hypothetical protein
LQLVSGALRYFLEIVEGILLLRGRPNNLFDALHWQVNQTASLLIAERRLIVR